MAWIDVAVLKAEPDSLKFLGRDDGDPRILAPGLHLICVPLGDSGSVVAGTHVMLSASRAWLSALPKCRNPLDL